VLAATIYIWVSRLGGGDGEGGNTGNVDNKLVVVSCDTGINWTVNV
jgi:hypothetical protein